MTLMYWIALAIVALGDIVFVVGIFRYPKDRVPALFMALIGIGVVAVGLEAMMASFE